MRELGGEDPECHPVALLEGAGSAARAIGGWPATAWPPSAAERRGVSISMCLSRLMNPFSVLPYLRKSPHIGTAPCFTERSLAEFDEHVRKAHGKQRVATGVR